MAATRPERRAGVTETQRNLADIRAVLDALREGWATPADRLDALAHRYLGSSPEGRGRIDPAGFAALLESELEGRFLHQRRPLDETQSTRMLAAALRRAAVDIEDRMHFVPCRLFDGPARDAVTVGPVVFHRTEAFREDNAAALAADPEFSALFERDFASWDWVAAVTVRGCDRVISRRRGIMAVDAALDILRLYAGAGASRRLGRAGAPGLPGYSPGGLWVDESGRMHPVRASTEAPPSAGFAMKQLYGADGLAWRERAGATLEPVVDPALAWPLAARFRESASWFGEGVTENSDAARILAFVTAIERAVVIGDHAEIWRTVTGRAALLAAGEAGGDAAEWRERAEAVYEARSQIVHGAISPFAPEAGAMAPAAARLAEAALRGALSFYEGLGLRRSRVTVERLEGGFRRLEGGDGG